MAVLVEQVSEMCVRHYSDQGFKLRQVETGELFDDAIDVIPCQFTYVETTEPAEEPEIDDAEALRIITGETEG